uniref:tRNA(Ile)-lysidine synthase, chloroplastic n=1 Tax=Alsidium seaforthii TaxID=2007182 RepID=A0A1Z1MDI3_9FLOR|nr:tRNA Ile-lysidine synthetase [Bryothamnion seaforthii]ARW63875.1 tRNA Ile-lysidine synthetase [Bryothamnion seaforthii]
MKKNVLTAISGGQDSIYLIEILKKLRKHQKLQAYNLHIIYIYIDHQWRNDSKTNVKHIINYIKSINGNIHVYQDKYKILSESDSRIIRYHIIFQHALKNKCQLIVTAHNKTDKIETFLQNLLRGCGIEGATSLITHCISDTDLNIFRPLLNTTRNQIYWKCKRYNLPIWSDMTNYIYNIQRNRTRNELVPYLKKYFHNNLEKNIEYLLKSYYYDSEYIRQSVIKVYLNIIHNKYISINYQKLKKQNIALQFRTIQLFSFHNLRIQLDHKIVNHIVKTINNKLSIVNIDIKYKYLIFNFNRNWMYLKIQKY